MVKYFTQNGVYSSTYVKKIFYIRFFENEDTFIFSLNDGSSSILKKKALSSNNFEQKSISDLTEEQKKKLFKMLLEN